ncbi:MAG: phosphoadenylyl-sulfate reductase [Myxococcota bacterium]
MAQLELVRPARLSDDVLEAIRSGDMNDWAAERLIEWSFDRFAPRVALSASFGSPEGMVILHMMQRVDPNRSRVFTIDTGRLPQETYNLMDRVRERYGIEIEIYFPRAERVEALVREHGLNLFYESLEKRRLCCGVRKVEPLERALAGLDAWITGLRPGQSVTRDETRAVEIDELHDGRVKINPLVRWSKEEVWTYIREHSVPVNALHAKGYPSVGCAPCSRAIKEGEDDRAGRWWWERADERECGIHVDYEEQGSGI